MVKGNTIAVMLETITELICGKKNQPCLHTCEHTFSYDRQRCDPLQPCKILPGVGWTKCLVNKLTPF